MMNAGAILRSLNALRNVRRGFIAEWAVMIAVLLFGTTTLLQAFVIPTGSMENTLLVGDHVFVDKLAYAPAGSFSRHWLPYRDVERGDIIILRYPLDLTMTYVKRAVGLPGDRVRLVNKRLILNGNPVDEPYARHIDGDVQAYRDNFPAYAPLDRLRPRAAEMIRSHVVDGELLVPPGFVFAMGDNRENSDDCRFWGLVPRENIVGTPLFVWWSYDAPTEQLIDGNIGVDHAVDVATHFFTKTRWQRMFRLIRPYPLNAAAK